MKSAAAVLGIARREFGRIAARPVLLGLLVAGPLLLFALIGSVYSRRVVTDIPVAVCDLDRTALSRSLERMVESTRSLKVVATVASVEEMESAMRAGRTEGGFLFPRGMEADLKAGQATHLVVYKNTQNLIIGNLIYRDAAAIARTVSGGALLRRLRLAGFGEDQAMGAANPIRLDVYSVVNPGYNYANFLVSSLLPVMLQMMLMLAAVLALNSEGAEGTLAAALGQAGGEPWVLLAGKALPYAALGMAQMLALLGLVFPLLAIPVDGDPGVVFGLSALLVAASVSPALMISSLVSEAQLATELTVFATTPAFLLSGHTFPLRAMPAAYQAVAQLAPSTHFLNGFVKAQQPGSTFAHVIGEALALALFAVLPLLICRWRLPRLLRAPTATAVAGARP